MHVSGLRTLILLVLLAPTSVLPVAASQPVPGTVTVPPLPVLTPLFGDVREAYGVSALLPEVTGPSDLSQALSSYVSDMGAELDEDAAAHVDAFEDAMPETTNAAFADLFNALAFRERSLARVFDDLPEAGLTQVDQAALLAAQLAVVDRSWALLQQFPADGAEPPITPAKALPSGGPEQVVDWLACDSLSECDPWWWNSPDGELLHRTVQPLCITPDELLGPQGGPVTDPIDEACKPFMESDRLTEAASKATDGTLQAVDAVVSTIAALMPPPPVINVCPWILINLRIENNVYDCEYRFQFDAGGDDRYTGNAGGANRLSAFAIDIEGDDEYDGRGKAHSGAAVLSAGGLIDVRGNDIYRHHSQAMAGMGAAVDGTGLLLDLNGSDRYEFDASWAAWSVEDAGIGVAATGSVAGTGTGFLADLAGDDLYLVRGPRDMAAVALNGAAAGRPLQGGDWTTTGTDDPSDLSGVAQLLDVQGNDRYEDTTGPCWRWCGAVNGAASPFASTELAYPQSPAHTTNYKAALLDYQGDDAYDTACKSRSARNGAWGLLYDFMGADFYRDGLVASDGGNAYVDQCEPGIHDETIFPKPGSASAGGQIDAMPSGPARPLGRWLVSPAQAVGSQGQACSTSLNACTQDPALLAAQAGGCLTSQPDLCSELLYPWESDSAERAPRVDGGRIFWLREGRLFMSNALSSSVIPIPVPGKVSDFAVHGQTLVWIKSPSGPRAEVHLFELARATDRVIGTGSVLTAPDAGERFVAWQRGTGWSACVMVYDLHEETSGGTSGGMGSCVANGEFPRVSGDNVAFIQYDNAFVKGMQSGRWTHLGSSVTDVAIDGDLVVWKSRTAHHQVDGPVLARNLADPWERTFVVGQHNGATQGLDVSDSFVVWTKSQTVESLLQSPLLGRDISHLRYTPQDLACVDVEYEYTLDGCTWKEQGLGWQAVQAYDDGLRTAATRAPTALSPIAGSEILVSDPLTGAARPSLSRNLIAWEAGNQVHFAHSLGPALPELALITPPGDLEKCYDSPWFGNAPDTVMNSEVGAPDVNADGFGDCWLGYFVQIAQRTIDLVSDLDCDTLNNLEEFRWEIIPIYDLPPCATVSGGLGVVVFSNGRDHDLDGLLDGYEARFIERANGGGPLEVAHLVDAGVRSLDDNAATLALYHPLRNHDADADGSRDMEDRNSDSAITQTNQVTDTLLDGEEYAFGTFPDFGDSDCAVTADECHDSRTMARVEANPPISAERGTGDGLSDSREIWYWLHDEGTGLTFDEGDEEGLDRDEISNALLDPDSDGDGDPDGQECLDTWLSVLGHGPPAQACDPTFEPPVGGAPDSLSAPRAANRVAPCPSAARPDSDADGYNDHAERLGGSNPCDAASIPDEGLAAAIQMARRV